MLAAPLTQPTTGITLICPSCRQELALNSTPDTTCPQCKLPYTYQKNKLSYHADTLLQQRFRKQWLLNKALNNNGHISYLYLKEGSLSLPEREDVQIFGRFVAKYCPQSSNSSPKSRVLDIGCGVLPLPGYLQYLPLEQCELFGLDPIENPDFQGFFIQGCAEYLPFENDSLDAVIYGTSLDHVVDLDRTLAETRRVLKPDGKVIIWMSDRTQYLKQLAEQNSILHQWKTGNKAEAKALIQKKWHQLVAQVTRRFDESRYWSYPNGTVLYVPDGAVDPFHSFHETPQFIIDKFHSGHYQLVEQDYVTNNLVLLCFQK